MHCLTCEAGGFQVFLQISGARLRLGAAAAAALALPVWAADRGPQRSRQSPWAAASGTLDIVLEIVLGFVSDIVCDVAFLKRLHDIVGQTYDIVCKHTFSYVYLQCRFMTYDIVF